MKDKLNGSKQDQLSIVWSSSVAPCKSLRFYIKIGCRFTQSLINYDNAIISCFRSLLMCSHQMRAQHCGHRTYPLAISQGSLFFLVSSCQIMNYGKSRQEERSLDQMIDCLQMQVTIECINHVDNVRQYDFCPTHVLVASGELYLFAFLSYYWSLLVNWL